VIEEVLSLRINPDYFRYLRHKIERAAPTRQNTRALVASRIFSVNACV
jgi:hypothetical protein